MTSEIGDNSLAAGLARDLPLDYEGACARTQELLDAVDRLPKEIGDDEMSGKFGDFVAQITKHCADLKAKRKKEKDPYLGAGRVVDTFFNNQMNKLGDQKRKIAARQTGYLLAKENAAREEAKRLADEARKRAEIAPDEATASEFGSVADAMTDLAEAKAADLSRVRGVGSTTSLVTTMSFVIEDISKIPMAALRPFLTRPDWEKIIKAYVAAGNTTLKGVRIFETKTARTRG